MSRRSIDWRRGARAALRLMLYTAGWLLTHGGRLLQSSGETLGAVGDALWTPPLNPRRQ